MLQGGLRPGEVLGLHLEDIAYGRRRVVVRHRDDHPKGARSKSRYERVVDLHEPETLAIVSAYVMDERPADGDSPLVFLIGGRGKRRLEALSYDGLVKMFTRATTRAGIRTPWVTPHACRHTHATAMWEGGMRELTLQKRLGHASPESTRIYTRVSIRLWWPTTTAPWAARTPTTASSPDGRADLGRRAGGDLGDIGGTPSTPALSRVRVPRLRARPGHPPGLPQPEDPLLPCVQGCVAEDGGLVRAPLVERVGRLPNETQKTASYPISFNARPYLLFLPARLLTFDYAWMFGAGQIRVDDAAGRLASTWARRADRGSCRSWLQPWLSTAGDEVDGGPGRAAHRHPAVSEITDDHITEALEAIRLFSGREDLDYFYPSAQNYRDNAAKQWITRLHQLRWCCSTAARSPPSRAS